MNGERLVRAYGSYFVTFINSITEDESRKIFYVLDMLKIRERLSEKFVKYIDDGIFELRAEHNGNNFRVFFIFDEGNVVLLLNGFRKKSKKTPKREIELAKSLKKRYYDEKGE